MQDSATPQGTASYAQRYSTANPTFFRTLGKTELTVSACGFGGYRIHHHQRMHKNALRRAFLQGCNIVDTSSNYADGGSEILVGQVIRELISRGDIRRDEVVVVSKGGYAQGQNLAILQDAESSGFPFPDVVKYMDGCWHCIHPSFLEDQLTRSLQRLELRCIDVYLLHNPEYYLKEALRQEELELTSIRKEYYRRITQALDWMEEQVAAGRIGSYGISSNTFGYDHVELEFTDLERIHSEAGPHFSVVQLPLNLFERGALLEKGLQGASQSTIDYAAHSQIGVLGNRPLNGFISNRLIRLANFYPEVTKNLDKQLKGAFSAAQDAESRISSQMVHTPELVGVAPYLSQYFQWAHALEHQYQAFYGLEHWQDIREYQLGPSISHALHHLDTLIMDNTKLQGLSHTYRQAMGTLIHLITTYFKTQSQKRSNAINADLVRLFPELEPIPSLSQKAVHILTSLPEVTSVLVGMRRAHYVDDIIRLKSIQPLTHARLILERLETSEPLLRHL